MSLKCVRCSRVNPDEAVYCYHDGFALDSHGKGTGPVAVGAQQFSNPFVFPTGRTCRSFDELAIACQEDWASAKELLGQGFFHSFFGGMGRADLARGADEAKKFGDLDRGLDQLLDKLPTQVLQEPKLRVDPQEINLGTLEVGTDREIELTLENQGMRLLHGKVSAVDTPWLTLGEGQGVSEKIFQFNHDTKIRVHVKGNKLRANNKPIEGKLLVAPASGDPVTVQVKVEVPVKSYPGNGPLAGARSPRQVAEKAKAKPKEAAVLFEKGEVSEWYKSNGWVYPVQGPTAVGVGAVQQFFEALGLTPPPKVDISHRSVSLTGNVGQQNLRHVLEIKTEEKRPVYASGSSNQPWLEVGRAKLNGRVASIVLTVPIVPDRPGETLTAKVMVQANGNQKFVVPITLQVGDNLDFTGGAPIPILTEAEPAPKKRAAAAIATMPAVTLEPPAPQSLPEPTFTPRVRKQSGLGMHWLTAAMLAVALMILVVADLTRGKDPKKKPDEPTITDGTNLLDMLNSKPGLRIGTRGHRFGFSLAGVADPNNPKEEKRLTFDREGATNNTIIKINNYEFVFGSTTHASKQVRTQQQLEIIPNKYFTTKIEYLETGVEVTQHILLVPGSSDILDNCLVYYSIVNKGRQKPSVGVRVLLDTFIGANDGVPFTIPGRKELVRDLADLPQKEIPDYVEAVENGDNADEPGTVARLGLGLRGLKLPPVYETDTNGKPRLDKKKNKIERFPMVEQFDEMTRLVICQQPENPQVRWNWGDNKEDFQPIATKLKKDSCAVMYWDDVALNPGDTRNVGFTYGLSSLKISGGKGGGTGLALSAPSGAIRGKDFDVVAYVYNAKKGQNVTLILPDGLEMAPGENATKTVEKNGTREPVTFKVRGTKLGKKYKIEGKTGNTKAEPVEVSVRETSIFG